MLTFISDKFLALLKENQLDTFEKVWNRQVDWFEEPNERRGGWSGVGRIALKQRDGGQFGAFVKKQDRHQHKSWRHPIKGVPTFEREFLMMRYLEKRGVAVPEVMLFGRNPSGDLKTVLLTKNLSDFVSLEDFTAKLFADKRPALAIQRAVVNAVANFSRKLHTAKVQHRSFYPKHLFVNATDIGAPDVAVIDLEKSRINLVPFLRTFMDLAALNRHAEYWSKSRRMYFYLRYMGLDRLTPYAKWLCRRIIKRSQRVRCN